MGLPPEEQEVSEAAAKLGKKGAQAAKEARKAKPKEEKVEEAPEEEKPEQKAKATPKEEPEEEPEKADEPKEKKPGRVEKLQGQIARLAAERRTEEERIAKLRKEREELERPKEAPKAAKAVDDDPEPDFNDSEKYPEGRFDSKFLDDKIQHGIRKGLKAQREADARERVERDMRERHEKRATEFQERMTTALEDEDFHSRLQAIPDDPVKSKVLTDLLNATPYDLVPEGEDRGPLNLIAHWLLSSPLAPQVTLHLAEHPEEHAKLLRSDPDGLLRSLARLEAKLEQPQERPPAATAGTVEKPYVPPAPPLRPVKSGAHTDTDDELDDTLPLKEVVRRHGQRQLAKSR